MSKISQNPVERAEAELAQLEAGMQQMPQDDQQNASSDTSDTSQQQTPAAEPPKQQPPADDYEQRWKTLQGIVKAKDQQLSQLMEKVNELTARVEAASQPVTQQPPTNASQSDLTQHLASLVDEYGEDMIQTIQKVSDYTQGGKITSLEQQIAELKQQLARVNKLEEKQQQSDSDEFLRDLDAAVPGWREVYQTDAFELWKSTTKEPYTGMTFGDLFDRANKEWNLDGVAGVFNAYNRTKVKQAPNQQQQVDPRLAMVTPGSRSAGSATADPPRIWTTSEVNKVFDNMRKNLYTAEEAMRLDREISEADAQGRIRPG